MLRPSARDLLLVRHFLQRFVDNDLISPHADRHDVLSMVVAALVTSGLFISVLLSLKYMFKPFQTPGWTAVTALDDQFLFVGASMLVSSLVAVAEWDSLALDARDTAILGPLPIPARMIVRAKVTAVVLFASAFVTALNIVPSVVHPMLMIAKLPVGLLGLVRLAVVQALVTVAAGAFGFLVVLMLRELLQACLGAARFAAVSSVVQGALLMVLCSLLLLLPALATNVAEFWLGTNSPAPHPIPPLWFVGLHERLAGSVLDGLVRGDEPTRILEIEEDATHLYRSHEVVFRQLGDTAAGALVLAAAIAAAVYVWNSRRLPMAPPTGPRRRRWKPLTWLARRCAGRSPIPRAAYLFSLQTLSRSTRHRSTLAVFGAVGFALGTVLVRQIDIPHVSQDAPIPLGLLALQTVFIAVLLAGFRHAIRVPGDLEANWIVWLTLGNKRRYLAGVKRAALVSPVMSVLILLLPLQVWALGPGVAVRHFLFGLLLAFVLLEVLLHRVTSVPLASSYTPDGNLKMLAPIYLSSFILGTYVLARIEQVILGNTSRTALALVAMMVIWRTLHATLEWSRRDETTLEFDEQPASAPRLDLSG